MRRAHADARHAAVFAHHPSARARLFALPGVTEQPSRISVPGARALSLDEPPPSAPPEASIVEAEFAHRPPGRFVGSRTAARACREAARAAVRQSGDVGVEPVSFRR